MGAVITEAHRTYSFQQTAWMREYTQGMPKRRAEVNGVDDDLADTIKLCMISPYGRLLQDKRGHKNMNACKILRS